MNNYVVLIPYITGMQNSTLIIGGSFFSVAKSTRIIHHNQLLMTKFGRILCLTRKWRQNSILLQVNAPLTEKTWGRDWVVFFVKTKMVDTSLVSRVRTTAGTGEIMAKNIARRLLWITPSSICLILHILRKPNSLIAKYFFLRQSFV